MYRVELTKNSLANKPRSEKIGLVKADFEALKSFASAKMQIRNQRKMRLFVCQNSLRSPPGTEITEKTDLSQILNDGILIAVSKGEDYRGKNDQTYSSLKKQANLIKQLPRPPGWPHLQSAGLNDWEELPSNQLEQSTQSVLKHPVKPNLSEEMAGPFPILQGNVLKLIRLAINDLSDINETEMSDGYVVFDYRDKTDFPLDDSFQSALIRECRGLILSAYTGEVLARRFPKFFNLEENDSVRLENLEFHETQWAEKIDGLLVSPVILDNDALIWVTRKCRSRDVEKYLSQSELLPIYNQIARTQLSQGRTPLFEWCTPDYVIAVLAYEQPQLTLLAIRDNLTGSYYDLNELYPPDSLPLPVAYPRPVISFTELKADVDKWTNREGVVLIQPNGLRYKYKSPWYVSVAKAAKLGGKSCFLPEYLRLQPKADLRYAPLEQIWLTALTQIDDVIAQVMTHLTSSIKSDQANRFLKFVQAVQIAKNNLERDFQLWFQSASKVTKDSQLLTSFLSAQGWPSNLLNYLLQNQSLQPYLTSFLCQLAKKRKFDLLTELLDLAWNVEETKLDNGDQVLTDLVIFDECHIPGIKDHVIQTYLPKKISQLTGETDPSSLLLPKNYLGEEGKFKGFWEMFTKYDIWDLRLDLQPPCKDQYTSHNGNPDWALLLVQYGLKDNPDTHPHGSFAGILIPTGYEVSLSHMREAMALSFETHRMVKLRRKHTLSSDSKPVQIYCDLDGVLADFKQGVINMTGRTTDEQPVNKMWSRILAQAGFFQSLPIMPEAETFWSNLTNFCQINQLPLPIILTGLPISCKKWVHREKKIWCETNLDPIPEVITCQTSEKHLHCSPGDILIDDRRENGKLWVMYDGIFIHFQNQNRASYELARSLNRLPKITLSDLNSVQNQLPIYECHREVLFLVDHWPEELSPESLSVKSPVIAFDAEWDPENPLALVQIATNTHVYLLDMIASGNFFQDHLKVLFADPEITKIGYGVEGGDLTRMGVDINNLIDLQELLSDQIETNLWSKGQIPSLTKACRLILNQILLKSKEFINQWGERPLSDDYCQYAANDAAVLLDIWTALQAEEPALRQMQFPAKNVYLTDQSRFQQKRTDDFDPATPVKVKYSALFLNDESLQRLTNQYPEYDMPKPGHLVLHRQPTERSLRGLPVGEIKTLACPNLPEPLMLTGQIGLIVKPINDPLAMLHSKVKERIETFQAHAQPGESLRFKPNDLSAQERSLIHEWAKSHNMQSDSTGQDTYKVKKRKLTLTKLRPKKNQFGQTISDLDYDENDHDIGSESNIWTHADPKIHAKQQKKYRTQLIRTKEQKIVDPYLFQMLNIVTPNQPQSLVGKITFDELIWLDQDSCPWDKYSRRPFLYILRGLPGSGKSHLTKLLAKHHQITPIVCSADSYFLNRKGQYQFDEKQLSQAHEQCRQIAKETMTNQHGLVIIDNTNSRQSEYQYYLRLAEQHEYYPIILEIECRDKEQAHQFAARNTHEVPVKQVMKMLARWEIDPQAILLDAYDPDIGHNFGSNKIDHPYDGSLVVQSHETLQRWLSDRKLFHFQKSRAKTHVCMGTGTRPWMFVQIPTKWYDDFLMKYAETGIHGFPDDEPKYLFEIVQTEFKLFFDIDYQADKPYSHNQIEELAKLFQQVISGPVYITTRPSEEQNGQWKTGFHFIYPETIVTQTEALEIRQELLPLLKEHHPSENWEQIVDDGVYRDSCGLRMLGSRKVKKGEDRGRIYNFLTAMNKTGQTYQPTWIDDDYLLLKNLSIHLLDV